MIMVGSLFMDEMAELLELLVKLHAWQFASVPRSNTLLDSLEWEEQHFTHWELS